MAHFQAQSQKNKKILPKEKPYISGNGTFYLQDYKIP